MKTQVDKHWIDKSYENSDCLHVKLQPYRQLSIKESSHQKLSPRYYGPFQKFEKINTVAFELTSHPDRKYILYFTSKPHIGETPTTVTLLPETFIDNNQS